MSRVDVSGYPGCLVEVVENFLFVYHFSERGSTDLKMTYKYSSHEKALEVVPFYAYQHYVFSQENFSLLIEFHSDLILASNLIGMDVLDTDLDYNEKFSDFWQSQIAYKRWRNKLKKQGQLVQKLNLKNTKGKNFSLCLSARLVACCNVDFVLID